MPYRLAAMPALIFCCLWASGAIEAQAESVNGMTEEEAAQLGEEFGIVVGPVDEEIQKELKLQRPQGVAVFEVIGNSRADYASRKP
jgi:hypothetical protein